MTAPGANQSRSHSEHPEVSREPGHLRRLHVHLLCLPIMSVLRRCLRVARNGWQSSSSSLSSSGTASGFVSGAGWHALT